MGLRRVKIELSCLTVLRNVGGIGVLWTVFVLFNKASSTEQDQMRAMRESYEMEIQKLKAENEALTERELLMVEGVQSSPPCFKAWSKSFGPQTTLFPFSRAAWTTPKCGREIWDTCDFVAPMAVEFFLE